MNEIIEVINGLKEAFGAESAPYIALYLVYRYMLRPLRESITHYLAVRETQTKCIEEILAEIKLIAAVFVDEKGKV